ncbi:hypothetical protein [Microbacterium sp. zg-B185]|nr:hypothetical protein [Microbacterium sp. zg-B185]MCR2811019.1 hypothetical protein [Microbacterium sp. zg.B185]WIM19585.1 hypothetical protein QNO12_01910 [Microbacterium sp. zg-B185]
MIQRRITVSNFDEVPRDVEVFAAASAIVGGEFLPDDDNPNEMLGWITIDQPVVHLPAQHATDVLVTIAIPADAPEGEQYATVWAQISSPKATGINTASRAGIRIYLSVGAGNGPPADFAIQSLSASRTADRVPQVHAVVINTGGRAIDVYGTVSLTGGPGRTSAGPFDTPTATTILPGQTETVTISLDAGLSVGPWGSTVALTSGLIARDETATLTFPDADQNPQSPADATPWWVPASIGVVAALVAVGCVLYVARFRKRRARDERWTRV